MQVALFNFAPPADCTAATAIAIAFSSKGMRLGGNA